MIRPTSRPPRRQCKRKLPPSNRKVPIGVVEMVLALRVARRSALKVGTRAANQLHALLFTAPEELKAELQRGLTSELVATAARFHPEKVAADVVAATTALVITIEPACSTHNIRRIRRRPGP
jgi:hypothetical protein